VSNKPKVIENRPSFLERIVNFVSDTADFSTGIDVIGFVFSILIGLGFIGYIGFVWLSH
jgi:hypothetical protein